MSLNCFLCLINSPKPKDYLFESQQTRKREKHSECLAFSLMIHTEMALICRQNVTKRQTWWSAKAWLLKFLQQIQRTLKDGETTWNCLVWTAGAVSACTYTHTLTHTHTYAHRVDIQSSYTNSSCLVWALQFPSPASGERAMPCIFTAGAAGVIMAEKLNSSPCWSDTSAAAVQGVKAWVEDGYTSMMLWGRAGRYVQFLR